MNSVITEATDRKGRIVSYDAECAFCGAWARRVERILKGRGFVFQPLPERAEEMRVMTAAGEIIHGAAAMVYLARQVWWTWPLWAVSRVPGMMGLLESSYRWIAARRYCARGTCEISRREPHKVLDWALVGCVLGVALASGEVLPRWVWMWSLAATLYFCFKWITWVRARRSGLRMGLIRGLGYWLLWPGMSPRAFARAGYRPRFKEWVGAIANGALG